MGDCPIQVVPGIGLTYGARVAHHYPKVFFPKVKNLPYSSRFYFYIPIPTCASFEQARDLFQAFLTCRGNHEAFKLILKPYRMTDRAMSDAIDGFKGYMENHGTDV